MDTRTNKFVKNLIDATENPEDLDDGPLHKQAMKMMGYDPIKEMRINKLEKLCKILSTGKTIDGDSFRAISDEDKQWFFSIIKNIKPLMFKMVEGLANSTIETENIGDLPIDVPFQTFSMEPANDWHGLYTIKNRQEMHNMQIIVVHEETPTKLVTFSLYNVLRNDGTFEEYVKKSILVFEDDDKPNNVDSVYSPISTYLAKLDNRTAQIEYRARTKCRFGDKKETIKIKTTAIYIDPSRTYSEKTFYRQNIEWTHSWEVRGHWRKSPGLGKNRQGERNVEGFTWVKPHKKGEGELLNKSRVVR